MNIIAKISPCVGFLVILAACSSNRRPAESTVDQDQPETAAPSTPEGGSAADAIAESRCEREARCDNIGADKKFSSTDDCMARVREDWRDDLNARACPSGVDDVQLSECLSEIRQEECSSPFDTIERVAACTGNQICAD